jgi:hypothetical protein
MGIYWLDQVSRIFMMDGFLGKHSGRGPYYVNIFIS